MRDEPDPALQGNQPKLTPRDWALLIGVTIVSFGWALTALYPIRG